METVTKFPHSPKVSARKVKTTPKAKALSARMVRRIFWQKSAGMVLALVASGMTGVSLAHIAGGVEHLTNGAIPHWQSWAVAVGLDVNYIAMEIAGVVAALQATKDKLHKFTRFGIPGIMVFSMAMNSLEFSAGAIGPYQIAAAVAMGVILPALVWLTYRVSLVLADV
jgi:hypothetical protein